MSPESATSPLPSEYEKYPREDWGHRRNATSDSFRSVPERRDSMGMAGQVPYGDPAARIWGVYLARAERVDKEQSERWTSNTDGILIFTGLFSAIVGAFVLVSYQQLFPDSTATTNTLLSQVSQQLAALSTGAPAPAALNASEIESGFRPTNAAIRVNILWFFSLSLSLYNALMATLMQQWTRKYLQSVINRPYAPAKRARIRAFFAEGIERFQFITAVEALPVFLHIAVLLFFVGLIDFLFNVHHTVAWVELAAFAEGLAGYFGIAFMPLIWADTPYHTQLTSLFWAIPECIPLISMWLRRGQEGMRDAIKLRRKKIKNGMRLAFEEKALKLNWEIDSRALKSTLESLDEDEELEEFLDGLPGLLRQARSQNPSERKKKDMEELKKSLQQSINPVTERLLTTCSSGFLPEPYQKRRLAACLGTIWCFSSTIERHFLAVWKQWGQETGDPWGLLSTETWLMAQSMTDDNDLLTRFRAQCVQALMAIMWKRGRWSCPPAEASFLLQRQLGISPQALDSYLTKDGYLELAVAANLLAKSVPLLREHDGSPGSLSPQRLPKYDLRAILNTICKDSDTSDIPDDLKERFVNSAEALAVFDIEETPQSVRRRRNAIDLHEPWTKVLATGAELDRYRAAHAAHARGHVRSLQVELSQGSET
ncbi:hypothetical protein BC834DRAFT_273896 [Gloeopeniophorella convolvens]|nr:hypothetical protein BC834DRAFT_273896 [Gloeopeniophorella convolvens]